MRILFSLAVFSIISGSVIAQPRSAIEFFDTTGIEPVSKIGWTGNKANGNFFIKTSDDSAGVTVKKGDMNVSGIVTAKRFSGDGSQITNLPAQSATIETVIGLQDSLKKKADTTWIASKIISIGIPANSIDSAKLATGAVTAEKIADNAVTAAKIQNGAIIVGAIAGLQDSLKLKADTTWVISKIISFSIPANSIDAAKLAAGAVITEKIADNAITTTKIQNNAVTDAKINDVSWAKVTNRSSVSFDAVQASNMTISGLTSIGGGPQIKMKKITGTTPSLGGGGNKATIPLGVHFTKILSVNVLIYQNFASFPINMPNWSSQGMGGNIWNWYLYESDIIIELSPEEYTWETNMPVVITIIYEE